MSHINILSIIETYRKLSNVLFQKLMNSYGISRGMKDEEFDFIESLISILLRIKDDISVINNYAKEKYPKRKKNAYFIKL